SRGSRGESPEQYIERVLDAYPGGSLRTHAGWDTMNNNITHNIQQSLLNALDTPARTAISAPDTGHTDAAPYIAPLTKPVGVDSTADTPPPPPPDVPPPPPPPPGGGDGGANLPPPPGGAGDGNLPPPPPPGGGDGANLPPPPGGANLPPPPGLNGRGGGATPPPPPRRAP